MMNVERALTSCTYGYTQSDTRKDHDCGEIVLNRGVICIMIEHYSSVLKNQFRSFGDFPDGLHSFVPLVFRPFYDDPTSSTVVYYF